MIVGPEPEPRAVQDQADTLRRILEAVEQRDRKRWVEIGCAIILALATVASAWCAYQATLWGGVQIFRLAAVSKAGREMAVQSLTALQSRGMDANMFINYLEAHGRGDAQHEGLLYQRFRPEMRKALDAWLKTDPFQNPQAPLTPFRMAEYVQSEQLEANRRQAEADQQEAAAARANRISDGYVSLTVLFAVVLFFGGIGGTLRARRLQLVMLGIAVLLFVGTAVMMGMLPVCRE